MRESQMKKIIALAVASAFVAPVYAAEITVGGVLQYHFASNSEASSSDFKNADQILEITATSELDNGLTVTGYFAIEASRDNAVTDSTGDTSASAVSDGGDAITIAGDFGKLSIGNASGALDATGDYTDIAPLNGEFGGDGDDASIVYAAPVMNGLEFVVSMTPEGDASEPEGTSYSLTYGVNGFEFYAGADDTDTVADGQNAYGVKGSFSGIFFAYEKANQSDATAGDTDFTGVAVSYKMGATTIGYENQKTEVNGAGTSDEDNLFISHSLGGGVTVYAQNTTDDDTTTKVDSSYVGIKYAF
jgi:hypothetical protein